MRDRYFTRLSPGSRVADLRDGKTGYGRALGPTSPGMIRVEWDDGEEEDVYEQDVVAAGFMLYARRR